MKYKLLNEYKPGDVRHKLLPFTDAQFKASDNSDPDVAGELEGYAAGLLNIDRGQDIIFPGAFEEDIADFKANGVVAYQHDFTAIIGKPTEVVEKGDPDYGLFTKAEIISTSLGADVMKLVRRGVLKTLSIGYRLKQGGYAVLNREALLATLKERDIKESKVNEIMSDFDRRKLSEVFGLFKIALFEYSVVTMPMNPNAVITGAKSEDGGKLLDGLPFSYHPLMMLAAVKGYADRVEEVVGNYSEEGRKISKPHRDGIKEIRYVLETDVLPRLKAVESLALEEKASPEEVDNVLKDILLIEAQLNGVSIGG